MTLRDGVRRLWRGTAGAGRAAAGEDAGDGEIVVSKVDDAAFFVGDLFRRTFGDPAPSTPIHYVAFHHVGPGRFAAVGYYHVAYCGEYALVGGLCVEPSMRKRGIGELLERAVYLDAGDTKAYFAYVGDPARAQRVGFVATEHPHLVVCWMVSPSEEERTRLIGEVAAIGPF